MPEDCGSTTFNANWIAIAASAAVPPFLSISKPTLEAIGCAVATIMDLPTLSWLS